MSDLVPYITVIVPDGLIDPPAVLEPLMLNVIGIKEAVILWFEVILENVKEEMMPADTLSIFTSEIRNPTSGVIVYVNPDP